MQKKQFLILRREKFSNELTFHWKFSRINGILEKVVPVSRWKLTNGNLCSIHRFLLFVTSSIPFEVF